MHAHTCTLTIYNNEPTARNDIKVWIERKVRVEKEDIEVCVGLSYSLYVVAMRDSLYHIAYIRI